jgi:hypothetical protein
MKNRELTRPSNQLHGYPEFPPSRFNCRGSIARAEQITYHVVAPIPGFSYAKTIPPHELIDQHHEFALVVDQSDVLRLRNLP